MSEPSRERRSERRVHLSEAAEILGVSKDAVRMRIKRGTLRSEKAEDGRVYVWVTVVPDADPNGVHPTAEVEAHRELVEELRDRVRSLEEANRENRRIIAGLTSRIPAIEAPQEAADAAETVEQEPEGAEPRSEAGEAREELGAERARREMAEATLQEGMAEERRRREEAERERNDLREQLYARGRQQGVHETAEEAPDREEPRPDAPGAQEPLESFEGRGSGTGRGSLWRRLFGR